MHIPRWARTVITAEVFGTAALFAALPGDGGEGAAFNIIVVLLATVAVSVGVGWIAARRDLGVRLLLANSALVPAVGLLVGAIREGRHTPATWYGYLFLWALVLTISFASSLAGYGIGRDPLWRRQSRKV